MLVKATKTMAATIADYFKKNERFKNYSVTLKKMTINQYEFYVDYNAHCHDEDFDYIKRLFNVICITYPYNYYACPRYITTADLSRIFKRCDKTLNGFLKELSEEVEA